MKTSLVYILWSREDVNDRFYMEEIYEDPKDAETVKTELKIKYPEHDFKVTQMTMFKKETSHDQEQVPSGADVGSYCVLERPFFEESAHDADH